MTTKHSAIASNRNRPTINLPSVRYPVPPPTKPGGIYPSRRRIFIFFLLIGTSLILIWGFPRSHHPLRSSEYKPHATLAHPYTTPGHLGYNLSNPFLTTYTPASPKLKSRPRPRLMEKLMVKLRGKEKMIMKSWKEAMDDKSRKLEMAEEGDEDFEWLRGRTVLLMGDSIDRYHLLHLCQFLSPSSPLTPLPWPEGNPADYVTIYSPTTTPDTYPSRLITLEEDYAEHYRQGRSYGSEHSRPWLCKIDQYDAVFLWGFWNGLDDGVTTPGVVEYGHQEEKGRKSKGELVGKEGTWKKAKDMPFGDRAFWPIESEHFNPPLDSEARMNEIFLPILKAIGRGGVNDIDLVEVGVGAWDLGMFRTQDEMSVKNFLMNASHPSPSRDEIKPFADPLSSTPLSSSRLAWFTRRLTSLLRTLSDTFPPNHPNVPRVQVRSFHIPPQKFSWPWVLREKRVRQLEEETKRVIIAQARSGGPRSGAKERGGGGVRYNAWAEVIRDSQEFLDHIHPGWPASWAWADGILYDLRKTVTGKT
ncbi:hypothetical protein [Phaffia rhodozyma]|uniref:PC-Esterase n=1 Tax=Phaffia rhodozyma TaxID=264483 RepID=A0A0F7SE63_PHARH|nr:hypothetical protein [Phaffia rhodozyma]